MRIGIDVRLQNETGVGRYIRNLTSRLSKFDTKNEYVLIDPSVRWHSAGEQLKMPREYQKHNLDLVHIPYFNVPITYNYPFVVTIHDVIIDQFPTGRASTHSAPFYKLKRLAYKKTMKHAVSRARAVIVPSHATKKALLELYPVKDESKVHVVYEGVDNKINKSIYQKIKGAKEQQYFLYVGNAYPHKNLERLVDALNILNTQHSTLNTQQIKLALVGKEDYFYKRLKEKKSRSELKEQIVFTGHVSDSELAWLYQNALALVYPSLMEGFGLPALEAMQNKCPVLASDIPVFHEVCKDAAVYFDPKSIESIADAMKHVIENRKAFDPIITKGAKRASEFSWDKMTKKTIEIYNSYL